MIRRLILVVFCVLLLSSVQSYSQNLYRNSKVTGICYASNKVNRYYIPPPESFFKRNGSKGGASVTIYYTGFTTQAKTAMEYAASVLKSMLPADTKFTVRASWEKITNTGVLAQSAITGFAAGWGIDALNPVALYPVALAEKIAGKSLNADVDGDITLTVNSSVNWYLGTDGNTPSNRYDLVTVVIHELCHGLGFYDSFSASSLNGSWGFGSYPMIYDTFIENFSGNRLLDTIKFKNNSTDLKAQLTGNQLYFNAPLLKNFSIKNNYQNQRAKLYAPSTWDDGSSVSHLDETATLRANSLMTPFIDLGEAIHDPGKYTFSILADLGWINTRIIHKVPRDTEANIPKITLETTIKSDTTYLHNRVGAVYSYNNFLTSDTLFMPASGADSYKADLTIPAYNTNVSYYMFCEDVFHRLYRAPSYYSKLVYTVRVGADTTKPVIVHTPAAYYLQTVDTIKFAAAVTDNLGIDSVYLEYRINSGASRFVKLRHTTGDSYLRSVAAASLQLKGHDSIQYKIFAVDSAKISNLAVAPKSGYYVTRIEEISDVVTKYKTDFSNATADFFNIGFTVSKPSGFTSFGLNTKHPYESPEDNSKTIEYTAILRHPLKFTESGLYFSYNELVLVEPGEDGSVFGSTQFYDYVIIDGSKDFGKTWFNLIDGYDCRLYPAWETAYNSAITDNNSTFVGTESMLQKHTFLFRPSDKISAGDTILVRFRLFSDPFANGWGWVIENLSIEPLVDATPEIISSDVNLYPNPGKGIIRLSGLNSDISSKPLTYKVYSPAGILIRENILTEPVLDISALPSGIYFIVITGDRVPMRFRYCLIK